MTTTPHYNYNYNYNDFDYNYNHFHFDYGPKWQLSLGLSVLVTGGTGETGCILSRLLKEANQSLPPDVSLL